MLTTPYFPKGIVMHHRCRPMLCVEVLEARLALSASPASAVEPPAGVVAAEVGPEPVAVGTDESGEVIYMISMPPSRQCMCRACLGTWDGPPRVSVAAEAPAGDAAAVPDIGVVIADRAVVMADRTGTPDVIVGATAALVALPPGATPPWQAAEAPRADLARDVSRDVVADQLVVPTADTDAEPTSDLAAPAVSEAEADALALGV